VPTVLVTVLLLYLAYVLGRVAIIPVLASFGLAYILNPIVEAIENRGFSRLISAFLAMTLVTLLIAGFVYFVVPDLWEQFSKATEVILASFTEKNALAARAEIQKLSPMLDRMIGWRVYRFLRNPDTLIEASQSWVAGSMTDALATAAGSAPGPLFRLLHSG
jgi:predicted PurR-regulated permease PerM